MTEEPGGEVVPLHRRTSADERLSAQLRALAGGEPEPAGAPRRWRADDITTDPDALLQHLGPALPQPRPVLRIMLSIVGLLQLLAVLPWMVDRDPLRLLGYSSAEHLTRDGALGLAVAAAGLLVAWRPRWAVPCLVISSVALLAQTAVGIFDTDGRVFSELVHLPSVMLTCLIGLSAVRLDALGPTSTPRRPRR